MAIIKAISSKASIATAINYVSKKEKTTTKLLSGINCDPTSAKEEMQVTKMLWGKTGGRTYQHYVHSYAAKEKITPEQAHKNAIELVKGTAVWQGYEVLLATHVDREHIHTHIIINSVNFENGRKLQMSKKNLEELKERCIAQSKIQGLNVPEKGKTFTGTEREETVAWKKDTYAFLKKAEKGEVKSYVQDIALAVMTCKEIATSRDEFIQKMENEGIGVIWKENHKYITFVDLARQEKGEKQCKIRNNKLSQYYAIDFGKETLENEFESHARSAAETRATAARAREQLERLNRPASAENRSVRKGTGNSKESIQTGNKSVGGNGSKRNDLANRITGKIIQSARDNIEAANADIDYKRAKREDNVAEHNYRRIDTEECRQKSKCRGSKETDRRVTTGEESIKSGNTRAEESSIRKEIRKSRDSIVAERAAIEQSEANRRKYADEIRSARNNNEQKMRERKLQEERKRIEEQNRIIEEQEYESIRKRKKTTGRSR